MSDALAKGENIIKNLQIDTINKEVLFKDKYDFIEPIIISKANEAGFKKKPKSQLTYPDYVGITGTQEEYTMPGKEGESVIRLETYDNNKNTGVQKRLILILGRRTLTNLEVPIQVCNRVFCQEFDAEGNALRHDGDFSNVKIAQMSNQFANLQEVAELFFFQAKQ
jgi:hypothetical protein